MNVVEFISGTKIAVKPEVKKWKLPFEKRREMSESEVVKRIFDVMTDKKSNLCVAADVETSGRLLEIADKIGPHICILKTHVDILQDFKPEVVQNSTKKLHFFQQCHREIVDRVFM